MNRVFTGDCRDVMRRLIADGVRVQTCVTRLTTDHVQCLRFFIKRLHGIGQVLRAFCCSDMAAPASHLCAFAFYFYLSQLKTIERLRFFDAKKRQQRTNALNGSQVCCRPRVKRSAPSRARFRDVKASTERLFKQLRYVRSYLAQCDSFAVRGRSRISYNSHRVRASFNPYGAITVDCAGQVCEKYIHV